MFPVGVPVGVPVGGVLGPTAVDLPEVLVQPDYFAVEQALDTVAIPVSTSRHNVKRHAEQIVEGMCLGVVNARAMGILASKTVRQRPKLTQTLVNFGLKYAPGFNFTSIREFRRDTTSPAAAAAMPFAQYTD